MSGAGEAAARRIEAQLALGQMLLDGGDAEGALDAFRAAARSGDARGLNMLGRIYEAGRAGPADPGLAAGYYREAAEKGDAWAMFNLGDLYARGAGVARDDAAAYALYTEAARRGHAKSLNMLGLFHEDGRFVPPDPVAARSFYAAGAKQGDPWAQFNLGRMLLDEGRVADAAAEFEASLRTGFGDYWAMMAAELSACPAPEIAELGRVAAAMAGAFPGPAK